MEQLHHRAHHQMAAPDLGHAEIASNRRNHANDDSILPPFEHDAENVAANNLDQREQCET